MNKKQLNKSRMDMWLKYGKYECDWYSKKEDDNMEIVEAIESGKFEPKFGSLKRTFFSIFMALNCVIDILYSVIYYYFAPFIVFILIIVSQIIMENLENE